MILTLENISLEFINSEIKEFDSYIVNSICKMLLE